MARLPEVAPAAARTRHPGRPVRRGNGDRAGQPAAAAGSDPRGLEPADDPAAADARYLSARRARADRRDQASQVHRDALRPAVGLCDAAPAAGAGVSPSRQAHRVVAGRGARLAGAAGRPGRGLGLARRLPDELRRRSLAARHGVRVQLRGGARARARGRGRAEPERSVRPDLFSQAPGTAGRRRDVGARHAGRLSGRRRPSHAASGTQARRRDRRRVFRDRRCRDLVRRGAAFRARSF